MADERFILTEESIIMDTLENRKLDFKPYLVETLNEYYGMYLKEIECNSKLIEEIGALDRELDDLKRRILEQEYLIRLWKQINKSKTVTMRKALNDGKLDNPCKGCPHMKDKFEDVLLDKTHCNICDVPYLMFKMINNLYDFKEDE